MSTLEHGGLLRPRPEPKLVSKHLPITFQPRGFIGRSAFAGAEIAQGPDFETEPFPGRGFSSL